MGTVYGIPLPICSCGVVPIYRSLVVRGVPATAAMAFLVATPELGVESVMLSVPLLGVEFTILRVACALIVALFVGRVIGRLVPVTGPDPQDDAALPEPLPLRTRFANVFRVGFGEVLNETAPWILVGLAVAALLAPSGVEEYLKMLPRGLDVVLFAVAGIPVYICASGATPLAAVLVSNGLSAGAAIALLLTGPATNLTTYGVLSRLHGRGIAWRFMLGVIVTSITLGYTVNFLLPNPTVPSVLEESHAHESPLRWICLAALGAAFAVSIVRLGPRGFMGMLFPSESHDPEDHEHHRH